MMTSFRRLAPAVLTVLAVMAGLLFSLNGSALTSAEPVPTCVKPTDPTPLQQVDYAECLQSRTESLLENLHPVPTVTETVTVTPSPTPTQTPTETPTETPTGLPTELPTELPTVLPTELPTSTPTTPIGGPKPADFPTASSVGPTTEPTVTYTGPCTVTTDDLVIENRIVNCPGGLIMGQTNGRMVQGVVIRNSVVNGGVFTDPRLVNHDTAVGNDNTHPEIFRVESSRLLCSASQDECRAVGMAHFTVTHSYLRGTHSGMWAHNDATIEDSYITTTGTSTHQSGLRMLKNSTLRGNTILCNPAGTERDGGCSADGVFYREFGVTGNLTIERNYFRRDTGNGQWFATRFIDCQTVDVCLDIKFTGNLFDLGQGTDGGEFPNDAGDVWSGNYWTDGVPALSGQRR